MRNRVVKLQPKAQKTWDVSICAGFGTLWSVFGDECITCRENKRQMYKACLCDTKREQIALALECGKKYDKPLEIDMSLVNDIKKIKDLLISHPWWTVEEIEEIIGKNKDRECITKLVKTVIEVLYGLGLLCLDVNNIEFRLNDFARATIHKSR